MFPPQLSVPRRRSGRTSCSSSPTTSVTAISAVYGAPDIKTPNLDRLAREGVRLPQFYANAPVCTPTRAALISGRYQQRVPLERPIDTNAATPATGLDIGLPATGRSLPQLLKKQGYATALIGKWHLGFKPEFQPSRHGFDYFYGFLAGYVDWYAHVRGDGEPDLWENGARRAARRLPRS